MTGLVDAEHLQERRIRTVGVYTAGSDSVLVLLSFGFAH